MLEYYWEDVNGVLIFFGIFAEIPDIDQRISRLKTILLRMPDQHLNAVDPIFIVPALPGGRKTGGGYWKPSEVNQWLGKSSTTAVNDDVIRGELADKEKGIIGITASAFKKSIFIFTVLHEIAHSVDQRYSIVPAGATLNDLKGVRYTRRPSIHEYAAEVYARYIINPRRVCRDGEIPTNEKISSCSQRLINLIRQSPAFTIIDRNWKP